MNNWDKPYPKHYSLDDDHPELEYVWSITTNYINKFITVHSNCGCSGHSYVEKPDGITSVEMEMWYNIKQMSVRAMEMCNYEMPDLVCITMTVGEFVNGETRIYKYNTIKKYKVNVRFYKSANLNHQSYTHDDSPYQFGNPNIRVGEFTGLFGNLLNPDLPIDEATLIENSTTPFTFWQSLISWLMSSFEGTDVTIRINR